MRFIRLLLTINKTNFRFEVYFDKNYLDGIHMLLDDHEMNKPKAIELIDAKIKN
jgi:hypothetical protein